jgi:hypothetical protein
MRRTSVSLPTKHIAYDPHEKPDRYNNNNNREQSLIMKMQSAWVSQSQRARYIKTGAIIFIVFLLFYFFSPSGVDLYHGGTFDRSASTGLSGIVTHRPFNNQTSGARNPPKARRRPIHHMAPIDARGHSPRTSPSCSSSP